MKTVVLDPGHGGTNPGAVAYGRIESQDNLRMALAVRDILQRWGENVIMTRTTDVDIPLLDRSYISNRNYADIFVSFHRNYWNDPATNGVEIFVRPGAGARERQFAQTVLNNLVGIGIQTNRGVKEENFSVLRNTNAPAMLLELGFVSNIEDNRLFDTKFIAYAEAIARGIMTNLGELIPTEPPVTPPSANAAIREIQSALIGGYGAGLAVDGIAGPLTRRALVRAFQTELNRTFNSGLAVDGIFGPRTKAAAPTLRSGGRSSLVWILQAALFINGFETAPDGVFGPNTEATVRRFQSANRLDVDGIAGPNTFERLFA